MLKIKKAGEGHQHPKVKDVSKVTTKEETSRLNADLPKSFYLKVKVFAMENDMSITDVTKEALTQYMEVNNS
ncbi:hypothetical protein ACWX0P_17360 [Vibrio mediterranei]|uniref:hypothetical protein n=1 Tax=Vibrio mediterranei TaxID=689 RepID=UPI0004E1CE87|nr:hypothetical protein [Vibrio mediterranei]MCG9660176.1 hypothetical protein [Vibrio mediterranei]